MSTMFFNSLVSAGQATPIIDAELGVVEATKAQLGHGPPTTGAEYRLASERLGAIAAAMVAVVGEAPWEGPAGVTFAAEMQAFGSALRKVATTDRVVALVMDGQAAAVLAAREGLAGIGRDLFVARAKAQTLGGSGNFLASDALQNAVVALAESKRSAVFAELSGITAGHAALVTELSGDLALVGEWLSAGSVRSSSVGGSVSVSPEGLARMAVGLNNCSKDLEAQLCLGPEVVADVRLTHGSGGVTDAFDVALAGFEENHVAILCTLQGEINARAASLARTSGMYELCDNDAAEGIFRSDDADLNAS